MKGEDWPVGATFVYKSKYGNTGWVGVVKEGRWTDGELSAVMSTKGTFYNLHEIDLESKGEFTERAREQKLKELGL